MSNNIMVFEKFFDWHDNKISNWAKVQRIIFSHGWGEDIDIRGISAIEGAKRVLDNHQKDLKDDEKEYLKGLLK